VVVQQKEWHAKFPGHIAQIGKLDTYQVADAKIKQVELDERLTMAENLMGSKTSRTAE
jgi:hypothetical protein